MDLQQFFTGVLRTKGWPVGGDNLLAGYVVTCGEGSAASYNPIDTILFMPGALPYNTFGPNGRYHVWNYPDATTGIVATAVTWAGWPGVARALGARAPLAEIIAQIDLVAEGSPSAYYAQFIPHVLADTAAWASRIVAGSPPVSQKGQAEMFRFRDTTTGNIYLYGGPKTDHLSPEDNATFGAAGIPLLTPSLEWIAQHTPPSPPPATAAVAEPPAAAQVDQAVVVDSSPGAATAGTSTPVPPAEVAPPPA